MFDAWCQMNIFSALGLGPKKATVNDLYEVIVTQARRPFFYTVLGVPDTANGRYDVIMLHAYVVMKRLKAIGAEASATSQALFDCMFEDMDKNHDGVIDRQEFKAAMMKDA